MPAAATTATPLGAEHKPILAERFKTKMCQNYERHGACPYEARCMFAHGDHDLRTKEMNLQDNLTTEDAIKAFQRARVLAERSHDRKQRRKQQQLQHGGAAEEPKTPLAKTPLPPPARPGVPAPKSVWLQQQKGQVINVPLLSADALHTADDRDDEDESGNSSDDRSHPDTVSAVKTPTARRFRHDPYSPCGLMVFTPSKESLHATTAGEPVTPFNATPRTTTPAACLVPAVSPLALAMRRQPSEGMTPLATPPPPPVACATPTVEPHSSYGPHSCGPHDVLLA